MKQTIEFGSKKWAEIPGYEGLYFVSDDGEILSLAKSKKKPRVMRQFQNGRGYPYVFLYKNRKMEKVTVHRAVLMAWVRLPKNGEECRHLDDCRSNNRLDNLAWGSRMDNEADKRRNGGIPVGERSGTHKLTEREVLEIRHLYGTMSLREIASKYGVSHTAIRRAALGIKWGYLKEGLQ